MHKQNSKSDERGMASIIVTSIIMIVLSLITIGFARVMSREQRQALDRQLSTQAFYAAESGINEAVQRLRANPGLNKTDCDSPAPDWNSVLSDTVSYSCLLIDSTPTSLHFDEVPPIGRGQPVVIPLESADGTAFSEVTFEWDGVSNSGAPAPLPSASAPEYPTNDVWGERVGVLRVDIIPTDTASDYSRGDMTNQGYSFILYPTSGTGGNTLGVVNNPAQIHKAGTGFTNCSDPAPLRCRNTVTLVGSTSSRYIMRLQAFYRSVEVDVNGIKASSGAPDLETQNGHAVIDATGKVGDVLRRIQVRMALTLNAGQHPAFAIQSGDSICKRLFLPPGEVSVDSTGGAPTTICDNEL